MRSDESPVGRASTHARRHVDVLLVEDERADYVLLRRAMSRCDELDVALRWVRRVDEVEEAVATFSPDIVLLDLHLPDAVGDDAFNRVRSVVGNVPIIVVTGAGDATTGLHYVRRGAQDFVPKGDIERGELGRTVLYALERSVHRRTLERMALYDPLTGLPNRILLSERVDSAIARASRRLELCAALYIDIDDFKPVNDSWGHAAGDHVLRSIGMTLRASLRRSDTVGRIGGDEFVCLLENIRDNVAAMEVAENILTRLARPVLHSLSPGLPPVELGFHASIGLAFAPLEALDAHTLIERADARMYAAKSRGGSCVVDEDHA